MYFTLELLISQLHKVWTLTSNKIYLVTHPNKSYIQKTYIFIILLPFQIFIFHTLITGKIIQISEEIPLVVDYNLIPRIHPIRIFY